MSGSLLDLTPSGGRSRQSTQAEHWNCRSSGQWQNRGRCGAALRPRSPVSHACRSPLLSSCTVPLYVCESSGFTGVLCVLCFCSRKGRRTSQINSNAGTAAQSEAISAGGEHTHRKSRQITVESSPLHACAHRALSCYAACAGGVGSQARGGQCLHHSVVANVWGRGANEGASGEGQEPATRH